MAPGGLTRPLDSPDSRSYGKLNRSPRREMDRPSSQRLFLAGMHVERRRRAIALDRQDCGSKMTRDGSLSLFLSQVRAFSASRRAGDQRASSASALLSEASANRGRDRGWGRARGTTEADRGHWVLVVVRRLIGHNPFTGADCRLRIIRWRNISAEPTLVTNPSKEILGRRRMRARNPIISARSRYYCGDADPSILAAVQAATVASGTKLFPTLLLPSPRALVPRAKGAAGSGGRGEEGRSEVCERVCLEGDRDAERAMGTSNREGGGGRGVTTSRSWRWSKLRCG